MISLECALLDDFKIYINIQTTTVSYVLSIIQRNRTKFNLAIINIKCHIPSKDNDNKVVI